MTGSTMVEVDAQRIYEDLRSLLHERFREAFLNREQRGFPTRPSRTIEAATRHFLFELPETRREIQKVVDEHTTHDRTSRSQVHNVYVPELLKELVLDIGREAWTRRYDGPCRAELKVRSSRVSFYQIRHPDAPIHAPP